MFLTKYNTIKMFFISTLLLSIVGCEEVEKCNDTLSRNSSQNFIGKLVDSAVEGVGYRCGDSIGTTDENGTFSCTALPVSFHIGAIELGSVSTLPLDKQVFPQDIVDVNRSDVNNTEVLKLAMLLQSLDNDKNASNGIKLKEDANKTFSEVILLAEYTLEDLKIKLKESDNNLIFLEENDVIKHLSLTLGLLDNNSTVTDTIAPLSPTLVVTPSVTKEDSIEVEVQGEANADVYLNDIKVGTINSEGSLNITLNTSGEDGVKTFNIIIQDEAGNKSSTLDFELNKDTTPPAKNASIDAISTDDTTPALSGNLPHGEEDKDTKKYKVVLDINGTEYEATNNQNGKWSIDDDVISELNEGFFSVTITVTDEAGNSSSTKHINKIEINNTAFLIDSAIEGIKYVSGKYSGYTDINGLFKYEKGAGVTFYIGDESRGISMGTAETKVDPHNKLRKIITLFDLSGSQDENNFKTVNMGRFLQTFDSDGDVSNGITIDSRTKESIALLGLRNLNFNVDEATFTADSKLQDLLEDLSTHFGGHIRLLSNEDAKAHLVAVRDNTEATKGLSPVVKVRGVKEEVKVLTGVFKSTTGLVEGLDYRCGNQFGKTNANGEFKYEEDKKVKFSISQLSFGTAQGDAVVTPANLVVSTSFDHPRPRNIIRLLSVLDADGNSANGIQIDNAVREALEKYRFQIDLNLQDGKANTELKIPQGVDEFGAQFEDFELGKEILDEIQTIRAGA
jgi:hypothetical protein